MAFTLLYGHILNNCIGMCIIFLILLLGPHNQKYYLTPGKNKTPLKQSAIYSYTKYSDYIIKGKVLLLRSAFINWNQMSICPQ